MDEDPLDKPCKVVIKKSGGSSITSRIDPDVLYNVMKKLLPQYSTLIIKLPEVSEDMALLVIKMVKNAVEIV